MKAVIYYNFIKDFDPYICAFSYVLSKKLNSPLTLVVHDGDAVKKTKALAALLRKFGVDATVKKLRQRETSAIGLISDVWDNIITECAGITDTAVIALPGLNTDVIGWLNSLYLRIAPKIMFVDCNNNGEAITDELARLGMNAKDIDKFNKAIEKI